MLTAEALNALAQTQRELSARVGRAGLASRYAGPQQLRPVPACTGEPAYLDPLAAPSSVAGCYIREPWVADAFRTQATRSLNLQKITRENGSPLAAGDKIFQKITVSETGEYISSVLKVFTSSESVPTAQMWEPGSGSSVILYRRIGSVVQDPRFATVGPDGEPLPFHPLVVAHADGSIPFLPRNAPATLASCVTLLGKTTGSTIPVKQLSAGAGVTLTDSGSSVEISASGGGGGGTSYPLAESIAEASGSVLNIYTTTGVIDGILWNRAGLDDSSVLALFPQPAITEGRIYLPVGLQGFTTAAQPSGVCFNQIYTSGAQRTTLATLTIAGETRELCAHYANGFLSLSFV